jgi:hypothetical protein
VAPAVPLVAALVGRLSSAGAGGSAATFPSGTSAGGAAIRL